MTKVKDGLRNAQRLPVNLLMGLHAVRKGYGIIFGLLLIVSFLISLPYRTVQTMQSEEFVTYMGSPVCDMLLEVEQGEDLEERNRTAENLLRSQQAQGHIASALCAVCVCRQSEMTVRSRAYTWIPETAPAAGCGTCPGEAPKAKQKSPCPA